MRILITAGPTREPIDPVRFISNHSSGQMGAALAQAAIERKHSVAVISGPVSVTYPAAARVTYVETTRQMHDAVMAEFLACDVLVMAAAVADFRPKNVGTRKITRGEGMVLELEPTEDIVAAAAAMKTPSQRVVGFSLEAEGDIDRARAKMFSKKLDLIVYNPLRTMNAPDVSATLLFRDGTQRQIPPSAKSDFARELIAAIEAMLRS